MASKKTKREKRKFRFDKKKAHQSQERGKSSTGRDGSSYVKLPEGVEWFKPEYKEGKTTAIYYLNVIPFVACKYNQEAEEGELWFRSKFRLGRVGAEMERVVSPSTFGERCPMSELFFEQRDNPDIKKSELDKLGTKQRELYYVVDVKEKNGPVRLLDMSQFLFGKILDEEMNSEEYEEQEYDTIMFSDPEEGRTLKVTFVQETYHPPKGKPVDYSKASKMSLEERRGSEVTDEMIEGLKDPLLLLIRKTPKQIEAMMADNDVDGGDSEDSELEEMTRAELKAYIKSNDLDIKVVKSMDDDDIRDAIQEAMADSEDEEPDEEEEEDDEEAEVDLEDMDRDELKAYIKANNIPIKVKSSMDDEDIRDAINEAMEYGEDIEEEEEEEEDDEDFFED